MDRRLAALFVCLSVVVAGCGAVGSSPEPTPVVDRSAPDRLGVESGVVADASLDVTAADGLDQWELAAIVDRTMARVELLRGLEFVESVGLRVVSRPELRTGGWTGDGSRASRRLRAQLHEATFLLGEDESVPAAYDQLYGDRVAGYYDATADEVVVVADANRVDTRTLAHELVHALQDRHFGASPADSRDTRVAVTGLREGDARYVDTLYDERCGTEWSCLPAPEETTGDYDRELFAMVYQPYADGAQFVHELRQRGGWAAVDAAYADPPTATTQTIHPGTYPDGTTVSVDVVDRSENGWQPVVGAENETLGELGAYVTLLANDVIDPQRHDSSDGAYSPRNYSHPATTGWAGDRFVPYTDGERGGYVWKLRWESPSDARVFAAAYREGLGALDARAVGDGVYVVPDGGFADAFRVERDGDTVVVTNGPTVSDLDRIRSSG
ncbi:MAG: hypothetical protein J07HB67_00507 [halophilic archaeon J07HB67]|nr:MAG: hypothetical protein J07HB67_00507 [halophilic archaeon J07HB67]